MSSPQQRRSLNDLWGLPRIPQWPKEMNSDEEYEIEKSAYEHGEKDYASLLGIKIQGLDFGQRDAQFDFTIQSSYIDLDCSPLESEDNLDRFSDNEGPLFWNNVDVTDLFGYKTSFAVNITFLQHGVEPAITADIRMVFVSLQTKEARNSVDDIYYRASLLTAFTCTMKTIYLETDIHCSAPSNCAAGRQRRVNHGNTERMFPYFFQENFKNFVKGVSKWPAASGPVDLRTSSATENFIAGEEDLYGKHRRHKWADVDLERFSRRFTTAFNTFWDSSNGPLEHSSRDPTRRNLPDRNTLVEQSSNIHDYFNATQAIARPNNVYRADRVWIGILLASTAVLQILAILGAVLLMLIKGPDILGFASSVTRDNMHIPLSPGGSSLDGPERARLLHDLRLQLADIRHEEDVGYIAFRAVPPASITSGAPEDQELDEWTGRTGRQMQDGSMTDVSDTMADEAGREEVKDGEQPIWRPLEPRRLYK